MFVPEKLKVNKFQRVDIPRTKNLLMRFGFREIPAQAYAGEDAEVSVVQSKLDAYREADALLNKELESSEHSAQ